MESKEEVKICLALLSGALATRREHMEAGVGAMQHTSTTHSTHRQSSIDAVIQQLQPRTDTIHPPMTRSLKVCCRLPASRVNPSPFCFRTNHGCINHDLSFTQGL